MRTCLCAGCQTLNECELVRDEWLCRGCREAFASEPEVVETADDGASEVDLSED